MKVPGLNLEMTAEDAPLALDPFLGLDCLYVCLFCLGARGRL